MKGNLDHCISTHHLFTIVNYLSSQFVLFNEYHFHQTPSIIYSHQSINNTLRIKNCFWDPFSWITFIFLLSDYGFNVHSYTCYGTCVLVDDFWQRITASVVTFKSTQVYWIEAHCYSRHLKLICDSFTMCQSLHTGS